MNDYVKRAREKKEIFEFIHSFEKEKGRKEKQKLLIREWRKRHPDKIKSYIQKRKEEREIVHFDNRSQVDRLISRLTRLSME